MQAFMVLMNALANIWNKIFYLEMLLYVIIGFLVTEKVCQVVLVMYRKGWFKRSFYDKGEGKLIAKYYEGGK